MKKNIIGKIPTFTYDNSWENQDFICQECGQVVEEIKEHIKIKKKNDLRKQFWQSISELAEKDDKIVVLVGDLGFSFCEPFQEKFPKQFINAGIAEQNLVGVAAGLALQGFKSYCYSNSIFLLGRAYEFVRDDICYNNLNVKLVGTGAAGFLGFSHNWAEGEEENLLKSLPIKSYFPKNEHDLEKQLRLTGPIYIRI